MATDKDAIALEFKRKVAELDFLWSNPLKPFPSGKHLDSDDSNTPQHYDVVVSSDINTTGSIINKDLSSIKSALAATVSKYLQETAGVGESRKRAGSELEQPARKQNKPLNLTGKSKNHSSTGKVPDKKTVSKNLQSQIATIEEATDSYLNRDLSELDVVSLPESLPTDVHNVVSLAELYYLTQTLPLIKLLPGTHKTLMTENFESAILEGKVAVLFSRIEELKRSKKWSLRQPIRYYDPFVFARKNRKSKLLTWDYIMQEGKWMATDFRESAKFKKLCCVTIAHAVQDYWTFGKVVCVKRKPIVHIVVPPVSDVSDPAPSTLDGMETDIADPVSSVPEVPSEPVEAMELDVEPETIDISKLLERPNPANEIIPNELPTISPQELLNAGVNVKSRGPFKAYVDINEIPKLDQSILRNLPKYNAFGEDKKSLSTGETSIVPVSRMLHPMENDDEWHKIVLRESRSAHSGGVSKGLPEYQKGIFGVQSHRRLNFLRPPKPPLIKNIEFRSPTIWLPQDDKLLIHYVAEYCFNWDLIAEHLQPHSATLKRYESNIERRTPWQCFERYIQLNEKFQFSDMKGINAYSAQQWLETAHKAQSTTKRRISPLGVGNESIQRGHRRLRWASMFDAMRKAMRKREVTAQKASSRKGTNSPDITTSSSGNTSAGTLTNGSGTKRSTDKTPNPLELSKLKQDRDKALQEAYVHQQATRSKMSAAVKSQKVSAGSPGPSSSPPIGGPTDMSGTPGQSRSQAAISSPSLQRPQASRPNSSHVTGTSPQVAAQLQNKQNIGSYKRPTTPNGTPLTVEQIQRLLQIQKQRRLIQQQQAQAGNGLSAGANTVPSSQNPLVRKTMSSSSSQSSVGSQTVVNGANGIAAAPGSGAAMAKRAGAAQRPRIQFPQAQVSAIINSIQQKNPNLTKDQVTKLAASYLANLQQHQQNKLNAENSAQRPATASEGTSAQARQAQLSRQRLAQSSAGSHGKEDTQTLSKMQYEERKKLMMQQGGAQYVGSGAVGKPAQPPNGGTKAKTAKGSRAQKDQ